MGWDKFEKMVELLKRRITQIVLYRLKDPRIGFLTITKIDLTRDMKECKVFYTVYGSEADQSKTRFALKAARGYIQKEVAKTLRTRIMPRIEFFSDESMEKVDRVNQILSELQRERPANPEENPDSTDERLDSTEEHPDSAEDSPDCTDEDQDLIKDPDPS